MSFVMTLGWLSSHNFEYASVNAGDALLEAAVGLNSWVAACTAARLPAAEFEAELNKMLCFTIKMATLVDDDAVHWHLGHLSNQMIQPGVVMAMTMARLGSVSRTAPAGLRTPRAKVACSFFNAASGCKKAERCNMKHVCKVCPGDVKHSAASSECPTFKSKAAVASSE